MARSAILDAAVDMIADKGMAETSVAQIAERAGVSKSAVFYHFGNKAGLFDALESQHAAAYAEEIERRLDGASDELEALLDTFDSYFEFLGRDDRIVRTMTRLYLERVPSSEELRRLRTRITHVAERARQLGLIRSDVDPLVMIVAGFSLIEHWFLLRYLFEDAAKDRALDGEAYYDGVLKVLLGGLLPPGPSPSDDRVQKLLARRRARRSDQLPE